MEKKRIIKKVTITIIASGLISLGVMIVKWGPTIINKIKRKMACRNKININDLPEEPSIIWEECEEG